MMAGLVGKIQGIVKETVTGTKQEEEDDDE
jgi:hypothetical protein